MSESAQSRQDIKSDVFRTVVSPEITNIVLKAADETGTEIALTEISDQRAEYIDNKSEPEAEIVQKEILIEIT